MCATWRRHIEWHSRRRASETPERGVFTPTEHDDVDLRTYRLQLRTESADRAALKARIADQKECEVTSEAL
jgi:hypothetical protein